MNYKKYKNPIKWYQRISVAIVFLICSLDEPYGEQHVLFWTRLRTKWFFPLSAEIPYSNSPTREQRQSTISMIDVVL